MDQAVNVLAGCQWLEAHPGGDARGLGDLPAEDVAASQVAHLAFFCQFEFFRPKIADYCSSCIKKFKSYEGFFILM
jgi:hypothetical protein